MKVLFVAAGRRNQFAKYLKEKNIIVHSYELDPECPIKLECEKVIKGKKWNDPDIGNELMNLSKDYDLIIPFHDEAVKILSELNLNNSCVSEYQTSSICLDKKKFEEYILLDNQLSSYYPKYVDGEAVLKPSRGVSSNGVVFLDNYEKDIPDDFVIQKRIRGTEYTIDCFFDKDFSIIDYVPRKRIKVVDGEVVESATVNSKKFEHVINLLSKKFKFKGPVCFQFIEDENGKLWIIEINARMGGGCTLSISAGFDIPELIISVFCKNCFLKDNYSSSWKENIYLKRYTLDYSYEKICI